jgi:hypothetical protein
MDSDSTLELLIKTVFDATGYRMNEAEAAKLKTTIGQTSAAAGAANVEDAKGTENLILKKRELMHVVNALGGQAVPELGRALSTLAYGGGAASAVFLIVGVFELVRRKIKEAQQATDDFNKAAANADFAAGAQAAATAWQSAVAAQEDYKRNLEEIKKGQHGITVELNNQLQVIAATQAANQSKADAEKTLALAKLKEDELLGRITESQAITRRGEIEKKYIEEKARAESDTFKAQQQERQTVINEAARKEAGLEKARDDAKAKLDSANAAKALAKDAPNLEDVRKAQQDAEAADLEEKQRRLHDPTYAEFQKGDKQRAVDEAQQKVDRARLLAEQYNQARRANGVDTGLLEADLKAKQDALNQNATAQAKAQDDLANANRTHNDPRVTDANRAAQKASEQTVDSNTKTELFKHAKEIEDKFQKGGAAGLSAADARELLAYLQMVAQLPAAAREGIQNALTGYVSKEQLKRELDDLRARPLMRGSTTGQ